MRKMRRKRFSVFLMFALLLCFITACAKDTEGTKKGTKRNAPDQEATPTEHGIKQVEPYEFYKLFHGFWSEVGEGDVAFLNVAAYPMGRGYAFEYGDCSGAWEGYDEITSVELDSKDGTYRVHLRGWDNIYDCDEGDPESYDYVIVWLPDGDDAAILTMSDGRSVTYQWGFPEDNFYKIYNTPGIIEASQLDDRDALVYVSRMSLNGLREAWEENLLESESGETHQVYSVPDSDLRIIVDGTDSGEITSVKILTPAVTPTETPTVTPVPEPTGVPTLTPGPEPTGTPDGTVDPYLFYKKYHGYWSDSESYEFFIVTAFPDGGGYGMGFGAYQGEWYGYDTITLIEQTDDGMYRIYLHGVDNGYGPDDPGIGEYDWVLNWSPYGDYYAFLVGTGEDVFLYQWGVRDDVPDYQTYMIPDFKEAINLAERDAFVYVGDMNIRELRDEWKEYLVERESSETYLVFLDSESGRRMIVDGIDSGIITDVEIEK